MTAVKENQFAIDMKNYWRLLQYLKPYLLIFIISILGFFLYAATQPMLASMMELFIDGLNHKSINLSERLPNKDGMLGQLLVSIGLGGWYQVSEGMDVAYLVPILIIFIYALRSIGAFIGNYLLAKASFGLIHDLRVELFNKYLELPSSYYDKHDTGRILSKITFNVAQVRDAVTRATKIILREGATLIALLIYLFTSNWKLTLLFFAIGPFMGLVVKMAGKHFKRYSRRIQNSIGDVTHVSNEVIGGYQIVKSFGGEAYERDRFCTSSTVNRQQNIKLAGVNELFTVALQFFVALAMAGMMLLAMNMLGEYTTGELVAYVTAAAMLPKPLRQLSGVYGPIQRGIAAAESIFEVLDLENEKDVGQHEAATLSGGVEIKNLSFSYPGHQEQVLKGINLSIKPGETVALVGHSGSGKTTLAKLLPRFYDHQEGKILLDGIDVNDYTLKNLRSHIGLVNQQVVLFNDTVTNNIAYGALQNVSAEALEQVVEAAYAKSFVDDLPDGLNTFIGEGGGRLSGGQRQRLSIARALLKDAPILILDEATSALDAESERYIQAALDKVMEGRTTLVIAHRLSTIEKADRIVVMEKGRIVEEGTHKELLVSGGLYKKLHNMQFD